MQFTEHEKRLISGAILAQMANISKAIENVGYTGDGELLEGLYKHNMELKELNSKVCSMMDDEDGNEDDFFEIVHEYKTADGSEYVNQIDTAWDEDVAHKKADRIAADWTLGDGRIVVIRYANRGAIYEKEVGAIE